MNTKNILKEACVLLMIAIMVLSTVVVTANTINNQKQNIFLEENFEEGIIPPTGWVVTGAEWSISTDAMYGNYSAKFYDPTHSKTADLISPDLGFPDVINVYIYFGFKNPDGLDTLSVSVSYGGPWYTLANYSDPVEQYKVNFLTTEVYFNLLKIKFTVVDGGGDGIYLDRIIVSDRAINYPPFAPTITGQARGIVGRGYEYKFMSIDPEGDKIEYCIDWGDNSGEICIGPYQSGQNALATHVWSEKDDYSIKAKAKDSKGAESEWATLPVSMPKAKYLVFYKFLNNFPVLQKLLSLPFFQRILET